MTGDGRPYVNTTTPQLSAVLHDPDDSVRGRFEWRATGGGKVGRFDTGVISAGERVRATVPEGFISDGGTYKWRVAGYDRVPGKPHVFGPWSRWCEFAVDTTRPLAPTATSTDFAEDGFGPTPVGRPGIVRFAVSGATDVVAYRYGFRRDALQMTVRANADGVASVPITMWHDRPAEVWVQAVDRAGNRSVGPDGDPSKGITRYRFQALRNEGPFPRVRGDVNGDGKADVFTVVGGHDRLQFWGFTRTGDGAGFHAPVAVFDANGNLTGQPKTVTGDFNGDGRTEPAVLQESTPNRVTLARMTNDGNSFTGSSPDWDSADSSDTWDLDRMTPVAADFNNDRFDDLAVFRRHDNDRTTLWVWLSSAGGFAREPVQHWDSGPDPWNAGKIKATAGDHDGDGFADIQFLYDHGNCSTALWVFRSNGAPQWSGFHPPLRTWQSEPGDLCWSSATPLAGDFNGDGKSDVATFVNSEKGRLRLRIFRDTAGSWGFTEPWDSGATGWDAGPADFTTGDFDGDGRHDIAMVLHCCGTRQGVLHIWRSDGPGLAAPTSPWRGVLHPTQAAVTVDPSVRYKLVNQFSGHCLSVPGNSSKVGVQLVQRCHPGLFSDEFKVEPSGNGSYIIHPAHAPNRCVEIHKRRPDNGVEVRQGECKGDHAQLWRLEYWTGWGRGEVGVRLRPYSNDKCVDVAGRSRSAGAAVHQWRCYPTESQAWYLRKVEPR